MTSPHYGLKQCRLLSGPEPLLPARETGLPQVAAAVYPLVVAHRPQQLDEGVRGEVGDLEVRLQEEGVAELAGKAAAKGKAVDRAIDFGDDAGEVFPGELLEAAQRGVRVGGVQHGW